jgi:hypothetical protein
MKAVNDIQAKRDRAKKQLDELKAESKAFFASNPYQIETKRDPQTKRCVYFLSHVAETPISIACICGDVVHNLRSTLDHIAHQLVLSNKQLPTRFTSFPVGDDASKYASSKSQKVEGMSKVAIGAIDALKPYKAGNDPLWQLSKLDNVDKHRTLITVGSAFRSFDSTAFMQASMAKLMAERGRPEPPRFPPVFLMPKDRLFPLKAGTEIFTDLPGSEPNKDATFQFELAFEEPEADLRNGVPIEETLSTMMREVEATFTHLRGFFKAAS